MALTSLSDLSIVDANNTSFSGISQAENVTKPSDVNDIMRANDGSIARYLSDLAGINQTIGGTANAITVTVAQTWTALANGQRMAIKNTVGPNTGATTIAVTNSVAGALGTKAIRLQGDSALVGGEMLANGIYEFRYDTSYNAAAGAWVLLNPAVSSSATTSNAPFTNFAIGTPTVAASALTIPFTGVDGNALSASNVAYVNFRSATAGSGAISQLALTALASLVISSGSTLGMTSGVAATLALAIFNDAGTARPAIINPLTLPLVDGIASATSEGGAGAADSAGVWYSNAAVTSKAYTIVGYITVTEATAGTWATAPSAVQVGIAPAVANAFSRILISTPITATSGSSLDFTGLAALIPTGIRRVTVNCVGLSTNGTSNYLFQIGDSGGIETTGYLGAGSQGGATTNYTTGIGFPYAGATNVLHGAVVWSLENNTAASWTAYGTLSSSASAAIGFASGSKSLSPGPLDRIRITTVGGTDTFDAGEVNILLEG